MKEQRKFIALRTHIDHLLIGGAKIVSRAPLTLNVNGHLLKVEHGMLIGYSAAA